MMRKRLSAIKPIGELGNAGMTFGRTREGSLTEVEEVSAAIV